MAIQLAGLNIDGDSWLRFEDLGVKEPVALALEPLRLTLGAVDSRRSDQAGPLIVDAELDEYSRLAVQGDLAPFAEQTTFDLSGKLSEFQLPTVSPYVEQAIGYRLEQGHLNLDFVLPVKQGRMDMTSALHLRRLRMVPLSAEDELAAGESLGLPVNLALSLLRNRDGDIFLKLPVAGDLNDPDISIGPVLRKALFGAIKNTVMLTLAPLGIIAKAGKLVGIGDALKFEPLHCEAGQVELSAVSQSQLDNVRRLLSERPQLIMSLCGQVTPADVAALQAASSDSKKVDKNKQLMELAMQRAEAVKAALVASGEVQASQLLLCNPSPQLSDGVSGVEISL